MLVIREDRTLILCPTRADLLVQESAQPDRPASIDHGGDATSLTQSPLHGSVLGVPTVNNSKLGMNVDVHN